jgi:hypothetical protein
MPNCFIVRNANGQQVAYVYYESELGRRSAAKLLSKIRFSREPDSELNGGLIFFLRQPVLRVRG